jgi:hypothetical protein
LAKILPYFDLQRTVVIGNGSCSIEIRGSEALMRRLRFILGAALFLSFSIKAHADSFSFSYVNSGYGSSPANTWETSGVLTAITNGRSPSCAYYLCWTVTDVTGQINGIPIVFSASSYSGLASESPSSPYGYIATGILFSTSGGQSWDLVHLEYQGPLGGQTSLAHPGGTPGAFGDLTIIPIPEPSVLALLMAAVFFAAIFSLLGKCPGILGKTADRLPSLR